MHGHEDGTGDERNRQMHPEGSMKAQAGDLDCNAEQMSCATTGR
jgi:hypothetical protein